MKKILLKSIKPTCISIFSVELKERAQVEEFFCINCI
jgi:hypothetical protein